MKVLMLNHEFPPVGGGAAPVTLELCKQLVRLGHDVDVVTMRCRGLPAEELIDGARVHRLWSLRKRPNICYTHEMASFLPGAAHRLGRMLAETHYDVLHCHFILPSGPLAWWLHRRRNVPLLVTCHGSDVPGYNPDRFNRTHRLLGPIWRALVRRLPLIVSPSNSLRQLVLRHCPTARVEVIPNGIFTTRFEPQPKENTILMCSRLLPRKGFQHVLAALRTIAAEQPDRAAGWRVEIVGEGPARPDLERLAADMPVPVTFHGWLDQRSPRFRQLYETAAVFAFPSEAENWPSVLLEAMSAGAAIVTSTAGGCPEVVGDAGLLVDPGDVDAIGRALARLMADTALRRDLGERARQRVQRFTWDHVAAEYVARYRRLAGETVQD